MAGQRYTNPHVVDIRRGVWDFIRWKLGHHRDASFHPVPQGFSYPFPSEKHDPKKPSACWINHSTFLITVDNVNILTDPIWSARCSPFPFVGPKRRHAPAIALPRLPEIDYILISHDHYDHLDKKTVLNLHQLFPEATWLVPTGVKSWFTRLQIERVIERGWWQDSTLESKKHPKMTIKATAVPAQHFSGRLSTNQNSTLWAGWVLEFHRENQETKTLYFAGDTGYNSYDFKEIGGRWKKIDLSLLPIGSYSPRTFMATVHVEPEDSARIHSEVGSLKSLAGHWKTFQLSDEPMNQPPYDLFLALEKRQIDPLTFLATQPGDQVNW